MTAYYNEVDPYAAQWLRNLIDGGHIARGDVDERSIVEVRADDLRGYTQAHFFAGIGGWSIALRLAGWDDDRPVWTGSCPCQPFSAAGAGKAGDDERHLWPAWLPLIAECRPPVVFGEQVDDAIGWGWLDLVFSDMEAESYACGAAVLPACSVGAPHLRDRLWFVADADGGNAGAEWLQRGGQHGQQPQDGRVGGMAVTGRTERRQGRPERAGAGSGGAYPQSARSGATGLLANPMRATGERGAGSLLGAQAPLDSAWLVDGCFADGFADGREAGDVANAASGGFGELGNASQPGRGGHADGGFWACEWLPCTDGKARAIRPGSFPLAHGVHRRPSKLRAYGNAIVPQVAAEFIGASMSVITSAVGGSRD